MRVLDVGCAAGHTALAFAPHVREVIGIDLSMAMLAEAARLAGARGITNARWEVAHAAALPYADDSFDIVTCRLVAHHFLSLAPSLAEMARVLKRGGHLLIVDIISPEEPALADFLNAFEVLRDPSHGRDWTLSEWESAGKEIGTPFDVIARWDMPQEFAVWTARQQTPPDAVMAIERLMDTASAEARDAFSLVGPPHRAFRLWAAFLKGVKR